MKTNNAYWNIEAGLFACYSKYNVLVSRIQSKFQLIFFPRHPGHITVRHNSGSSRYRESGHVMISTNQATLKARPCPMWRSFNPHQTNELISTWWALHISKVILKLLGIILAQGYAEQIQLVFNSFPNQELEWT